MYKLLLISVCAISMMHASDKEYSSNETASTVSVFEFKEGMKKTDFHILESAVREEDSRKVKDLGFRVEELTWINRLDNKTNEIVGRYTGKRFICNDCDAMYLWRFQKQPDSCRECAKQVIPSSPELTKSIPSASPVRETLLAAFVSLVTPARATSPVSEPNSPRSPRGDNKDVVSVILNSQEQQLSPSRLFSSSPVSPRKSSPDNDETAEHVMSSVESDLVNQTYRYRKPNCLQRLFACCFFPEDDETLPLLPINE